MRFGIRDGCLKMGWEDALKAAAEIGFDGVELDIDTNYKESLLWTDGPEAVARLAAAVGGKVLSFCAGVCWTVSPASPDESVRAEINTLLTDLIGYTADLGATVILVPVTPGGDDVTYQDGTARWIEEIGKLAPIAAAAGVVLALENVGRGYGKSAQELSCIVDAIGSPGVQTYYDIGNATAFENDPVEEIGLLGSRIADVHIKDRPGELLGEGVVKIPESVEALKAIGYNGDLVLETPPTDDPRAAAAHNLKYLQELI